MLGDCPDCGANRDTFLDILENWHDECWENKAQLDIMVENCPACKAMFKGGEHVTATRTEERSLQLNSV